MIERKADHKDLRNLIDSKLDKTEAFESFIFKQEFEVLKNKTADYMNFVDHKLDKQGKFYIFDFISLEFIAFDQAFESKL